MNKILLHREEFQAQVFERDKHKCIVCELPAKDAHHLTERRLFENSGYYIDNGVSLCAEHHIEAETTKLTAQRLRELAKIEQVILPDHLYDEYEYDKWGNIIQPNGTRLKGELFYDESVQKILKQGNVLDEFIPYVKYPRTFHVPFSQSVSKDDKVLNDMSMFEGQQVVITVKLDGENCLEENTIITTEDGDKTIRWCCETKYKGKVLCYNVETELEEWCKITNWFVYEKSNDWYEIILENDIKIIITENQYVWLPELKCYRRIKDLKKGDDFLLKK